MAQQSWTEHPRVVAVRARSGVVDLAVRTADNYRLHRTGRNATLVAHFGFLSVFPLFLVLTTILGFVLQNHPDLQDSIIDSAFGRIPIVGQQLATEPGELEGNAFALVSGLLLALWAGLKAFNALQISLDDVAEVPRDERPTLVRVRARSLLGIGIVGASQIGTAVLTSFVGVSGVSGSFKILFVLAAVIINSAVLIGTYRWLCVSEQSWRQLAPGAISAGVVFAGLQVAGTAIVGRAIANASAVYGTFATVIGLITWLGLHSMVALLGAELNHALPTRPYRPSEPTMEVHLRSDPPTT